jgi:3-hydroxyisobutyrate dehydrogenase
MKLGFIGLGKMGKGIATNLIKAGYSLVVYDIQKDAVDYFVKLGAIPAETPKEVAAGSNIVFTSLPGPREIELIALGKEGIINSLHPDLIFIDLSTNSPSLIRRIYHDFKEKGAAVMDAPVSGGPEGARTGKLAIMVGGDDVVFNKCRPILEKIGDKITYTGGIGSGSICKLMHNCVASGFNAILAECFTLGVKAGVEPRSLWQTLKNGAVGRGLTLNRLLPQIYFRGEFDKPLMSMNLGFKDLDLAISLGHELHVPMAVGDAVWQDFAEAINRGWGEQDVCSAMLLQEERAGEIKVRIPDAEIE